MNVASKLQFENLSDNEFAILIIELNVSINLEQIQLAICDEPALTMSPSVFFEKDLKSGERHVFETRLSLNESQEYSESMPIELIILVSFINKQSIARATKHEVKIPLLTLFEKSSPQKDGHFKATLSLSQPIDIESLFSGTKFHYGDFQFFPGYANFRSEPSWSGNRLQMPTFREHRHSDYRKKFNSISVSAK